MSAFRTVCFVLALLAFNASAGDTETALFFTCLHQYASSYLTLYASLLDTSTFRLMMESTFVSVGPLSVKTSTPM